jgi:hypothetical protein
MIGDTALVEAFLRTVGTADPAPPKPAVSVNLQATIQRAYHLWDLDDLSASSYWFLRSDLRRTRERKQ